MLCKKCINDEIVSTKRTVSSEEFYRQINQLARINDNVITSESTWSSWYINTLIAGAGTGVIDDSVISTTTTWSSAKIDDEINQIIFDPSLSTTLFAISDDTAVNNETTTNNRLIVVSENSTSIGDKSQVNCSENCTVEGERCQINASNDCTISATANCQINCSNNSTILTPSNQINASENCQINGVVRNVISASTDCTVNNSNIGNITSCENCHIDVNDGTVERNTIMCSKDCDIFAAVSLSGISRDSNIIQASENCTITNATQSEISASNNCEIVGDNNFVAASTNSLLQSSSRASFISCDNIQNTNSNSIRFAVLASSNITNNQEIDNTTIMSSHNMVVDQNYNGALLMGATETGTTPPKIWLDAVNGDGHFSGSVNSSGADYAEYAENLNEGEIPLGTITTFENGKIRPTNEEDSDKPLFVISATAAIIGNDNRMGNKLKKGLFGEILKDEEGNPIIEDGEKIKYHEHPDKYSLIAFVGIVYVRVYEDISPGMYVNHLGVGTSNKTNLYCLKMTKSYSEGFGVAKCMIR